MARGPLAGASGPGKFSARTDLDMGSIAYGEGKETQAIKSGAKLSKTPDAVSVSTIAAPSAPLTPLYAPTERKTEPITHGVDIGAGGGSNVLMMKQGSAATKLSDTLAQMLPYDTTGEIAVLYQNALARGN
jgi:hypothetical protein